MSKKIESAVETLARPIVEQLGYEWIDVEYQAQKSASNELTIYIDKPGGVDLNDCEIVSRALDEPLDREDPIPDSYVLCVSSPGLDRPLKKDRDLERAIGKKVEIRLFVKRDGKKEFVGMLQSFDSHSVTIETEKQEEQTFRREEVALIRLHIEF